MLPIDQLLQLCLAIAEPRATTCTGLPTPLKHSELSERVRAAHDAPRRDFEAIEALSRTTWRPVECRGTGTSDITRARADREAKHDYRGPDTLTRVSLES